MEALRPFAKPLRYNVYYKRPEAIEPIFAQFLTEPEASYALREVSEHTKVPNSILHSWREKVRANPDWRPSPEHFSSNARTFPPEMEATLTDFIHLHFVSQRRVFAQPTLRLLLLLLVQHLVSEGVLESQALNFKRSYHFVANFLKKFGLSFRRVPT
jgi:hypothetical protein